MRVRVVGAMHPVLGLGATRGVGFLVRVRVRVRVWVRRFGFGFGFGFGLEGSV